MNTEALQKVIKSINSRYPNLDSTSPKVTAQGENYLITFRKKDQLPGGKTLEQTIRVVADNQGNTLKVTSSKG
ncbi:MAG: hypothetical protein WBI14_04160 [Anaerolineaceae bacterium]